MITPFVLLLVIQFFTVQEQVVPPVQVLDLEVLAREYKGRRVPDPRSSPPPGPVSRQDISGRRPERGRNGQPTIEDRSIELNKIGRPAPPPPPPRVKEPTSQFSYEYRVRVKNTSGKKIQAIIWEYQLTDPSGATLISQKLFRCGGNVKSGDTKVLRATTSSPPTRIVDANTVDDNKQRAIVNRVEYTDGSTWTRDGWKEDDSPEGRALLYWPYYCVAVSP